MVLALSNGHASQQSFLEGTPLKVRVSTPSHKTLPEGFEESVSFSISGKHGFFLFGVAAYLQDTYDLSKVCFLGSSGGAFPAFLLAADLPLKKAMEELIPEMYSIFATKPTGLYFNYAEVVTKVALKYFPKDTYKKIQNRLFISLTKMQLIPRNERFSNFTSNEHMMKVILASCQVPYLTNGKIAADINGEKYLDGGFTDYQPTINANTIQVSPYMWNAIWGKIWPLTCLFATANLEPNLEIYRHGYTHAAANPDHWLCLEKFRKKPLISRL